MAKKSQARALISEASDLFQEGAERAQAGASQWARLKEPILSRIEKALSLAPDDPEVQHFAAQMFYLFRTTTFGLTKKATRAHKKARRLGYNACFEPWCEKVERL